MTDEVIISRTVKVNYGLKSNGAERYESTELFASFRGTPDALTTEEELTAELVVKCEVSLLAQLEDFFRTRGKKATRAEICRMYGIRDHGA